MNAEELNAQMYMLADEIDYQSEDISWLTKAMYCRVLSKKEQGKNRGAYSNGRMIALGELVLRAIEKGEVFTRTEVTEEELSRKRVYQKEYRKLFELDSKARLFRYAHDDYGLYDAVGMLGAPLPACDIYVEAVTAAIYLDRGFDYTKEWVIRFFGKYGYQCRGEKALF